MSKRTGPTNPHLKSAVDSLRRKGEKSEPIWNDVAERLGRPTRSRVEVNVGEINRSAKDGDVVLIPGVVLSGGMIQKKVNVAAWRFSGTARQKIEKAGGKTWTIEELRKENPKGTNVRMMV